MSTPNTSVSDMSSSSKSRESTPPYISEGGLHLVVDFAWSKFRNTVSEKNGDLSKPLYVQHFRPTKPQLRFETVADGENFATGIIHNFQIQGDCTIRGHDIHIKPLKRLKTQYNYLSRAFATPEQPRGVPITWKASCNLKRWNFICFDEAQNAIAKFALNVWGVKEVGNLYFEKPKELISDEVRDEVVVTALTIVYVMITRVNNPLNLIGAAFAKPGKVDQLEEDVSPERTTVAAPPDTKEVANKTGAAETAAPIGSAGKLDDGVVK